MAQDSRHAYVSEYDDDREYNDDHDRRASLKPVTSYPPLQQSTSRDYNPSPRPGRSRAPSTAPPPNLQHPQPQRPGQEAFNNAYEQADTSKQVNPDLVAQITEQVIASLKLSGVPIPAEQRKEQDHRKDSDVDFGEATPRAEYTHSSAHSAAPRNIMTPPHSYVGSNASSTAPDVRAAQFDGGGFSRDFPDFRASSRGDDDELESPKHTTPRRSQRSPLRTEQPRPKPVAQVSNDDFTTLEKVWQPLFGNDGLETARLGQFLRGLALHIIADYEPRNSIVVTPQKMLRFYSDVLVADEVYPWRQIFDGTMSHKNLSYLYRDIECEHFFVQEKPQERPTVPALTPAGFATWMTHVIRADPEHEYKRFADAVLNMPISNADDPKERFPKELSRRLFPAKREGEKHRILQESILGDKRVKMPKQSRESSSHPEPQPQSMADTPRRHTNSTSTRPHIVTQSMPLQQPSPAPYDSTRRTAPSHDLDEPYEPAVSKPIERERNPYSAQPGIGKVFSSHDGASSGPSSAPSTAPTTPRTTTNPGLVRPDPMPRQMSDVPEESPNASSTKLHRTASTARHSTTADKRSRRSSSLANKPAMPQGGSGSFSRSDSDAPFPPSAYTSGTPARQSEYSDRYESSRERGHTRSDKDRERGSSRRYTDDSEDELGRRYSRSSDEAQRERVRRYVVPEPGNSAAGGGSAQPRSYKLPERQHSRSEDEWYARERGRAGAGGYSAV